MPWPSGPRGGDRISPDHDLLRSQPLLCSAEMSHNFQSFGSWSKHPEVGPKSIGIGLRRFVGTAPGLFWLGCVRFGGRCGSQIDEFRPELFRALSAQPSLARACASSFGRGGIPTVKHRGPEGSGRPRMARIAIGLSIERQRNIRPSSLGDRVLLAGSGRDPGGYIVYCPRSLKRSCA
jgi:hypothetical protein